MEIFSGTSSSTGGYTGRPSMAARRTTSIPIHANFKRKYLQIIQAKTTIVGTVISRQRGQIITRQRAHYDKRKDDVDKWRKEK